MLSGAAQAVGPRAGGGSDSPGGEMRHAATVPGPGRASGRCQWACGGRPAGRPRRRRGPGDHRILVFRTQVEIKFKQAVTVDRLILQVGSSESDSDSESHDSESKSPGV